MIRLLLILITVFGYVFSSMAYNPHQCTACPTPTPKVRVFTGTENNPTVTPTTTPEPTVEPTAKPSTCIQECKAACKEAGLKWKDCKDDCDCR